MSRQDLRDARGCQSGAGCRAAMGCSVAEGACGDVFVTLSCGSRRQRCRRWMLLRGGPDRSVRLDCRCSVVRTIEMERVRLGAVVLAAAALPGLFVLWCHEPPGPIATPALAPVARPAPAVPAPSAAPAAV